MDVRSVLAWTMLCVAGCGEVAEAPQVTLRVRQQAAVYGEDDRRDVHAHPDEAWREVAARSTAAMFAPSNLARDALPVVRPVGQPLGEKYMLCDDEVFSAQETAATCSGTLIDDDLILTAGHCVSDEGDCRGHLWAFDYFYRAEGQLESMQVEDVYGCRRVLVTVDDDPPLGKRDWAIVQLDRPVDAARRPVEVRLDPSPLSRGAPITVIGYSNGTPAKIDTGGRVVAPSTSETTFEATSDTFTGHSGAGAFDADGVLVGALSAGGRDYELDGTCMRRARYEEGVTSAEVFVYAQRAVAMLCASGWPSARLCGVSARCGDGVCSGVETAASCALDCEAAVCGDGVCALDEHTSCPGDCGLLSSAWTCDPAWYAAQDGCDCGCGTFDPDCTSDAEVLGCDEGLVCDVNGLCAEPSPPSVPPVKVLVLRGGEGCAVSAVAPRAAWPGAALVMLTLVAVWRRRRARRRAV